MSTETNTNSSAEFENSRLTSSLEEWKARQDISLRRLELNLKEKDFALQEVIRKRSLWNTPLILSIIVAIIGLGGNALVVGLNGSYQRDVAQAKNESNLILEAIKTGNTEQAALNLQFMLEAGLLEDTQGKLSTYLNNRQEGHGPSLQNISSLYDFTRITGSSTALISNPKIINNGTVSVFEPPIINGIRFLADKNDGSWEIFCKEAGFSSEIKSERQTEPINCKNKEVAVSSWNYSYGNISQKYFTRILSNQLLICRNNTAEVVKRIACEK